MILIWSIGPEENDTQFINTDWVPAEIAIELIRMKHSDWVLLGEVENIEWSDGEMPPPFDGCFFEDCPALRYCLEQRFATPSAKRRMRARELADRLAREAVAIGAHRRRTTTKGQE